jgi:YHS domain-containing protein
MEVEIATAHYKSEYEGVTYYFCCAGCKTGFDKNPMAYLETTGRASSSE